MPTLPIVSKDVDSWCTKCKMMLAHTIEAVVDGRITRVHCNTCGGQHAYRASAPGTAGASGTQTRAKRTTRTTRTRTAPATVLYADLLRGRDANAARAYSSTERFVPNELIRHATFGLGVVTALKDVNKIEVLFAEGAKILLHRRG
jgi:hypothetical protein